MPCSRHNGRKPLQAGNGISMKQGIQMSLPIQLQERSQIELNVLLERHSSEIAQWSNECREQLEQVLGLSDFIAESLLCDEGLCGHLPQLLSIEHRYKHYRTELLERFSCCSNEEDFLHQLRLFRRQEMVVIAWRDFLQLWSLEESLKHLSELAEAMIVEAYNGNTQYVVKNGGHLVMQKVKRNLC